MIKFEACQFNRFSDRPCGRGMKGCIAEHGDDHAYIFAACAAATLQIKVDSLVGQPTPIEIQQKLWHMRWKLPEELRDKLDALDEAIDGWEETIK